MFTTPAGIAIAVGPALVFLVLALIGGAPAEWGRGALTAWLALVAVLVAALSVEAIGGLALAGVLALAMAAIITGGGGITGLVLAAAAMIGLAVAQMQLGGFGAHWAILPLLAAIGTLASLKNLLF